jgi:hypothetical protein
MNRKEMIKEGNLGDQEENNMINKIYVDTPCIL